MTPHPGELKLRQVLAQDASPDLVAHAQGCEQCKVRLKALQDEQRRFEAAIPFERFAAGVERAARTPRSATAPAVRRWPRAGAAIAAGLVLLVGLPLGLSGKLGAGGNRLKGGGAGIEIVVRGAGQGAQRLASVDPALPEPLAEGDRLRLGFRAGANTHLVVVSLDENGVVTAVEPASGKSRAVQATQATELLDDSLELTGHGLERLIVVLSKDELPVDEVMRAARARYDEARGNLLQLGQLDVPGEQFHRTFLKP